MSQIHALSDDQVGPSPRRRQLASSPASLRQQLQLICVPMAGRRRAQEDDGLYPPGGHGEGK